jgi:hypothetical protein
MATKFDNKFSALAIRLINKFGTTQSYSGSRGGTLDADMNVVPGETIDTTIKMSPLVDFDQESIDNTTVLSGDAKVYIAGLDWSGISSEDPKVGDIITYEGRAYSVEKPNPLWSGNLVSAWELQIRPAVNNA